MLTAPIKELTTASVNATGVKTLVISKRVPKKSEILLRAGIDSKPSIGKAFFPF
jgi:hypothetical protein